MSNGIKAGVETSEFWITVAAAIVGGILASGLAADSVIVRVAGIAAVVLNTLGYTVSRAAVKKVDQRAPPSAVVPP